MQIEVFEQEVGLHGGTEVWVKVLSNETEDWPTIQSRMTQQQANLLKGTRLGAYYPHLVTDEEREGHGYLFGEWWTLQIVNKSARGSA